MAARRVHKGAHKYQRVRQTSRFVWRCMLPDCSHFLTSDQVVGKLSLCHRCDKEFMIDRKSFNKGRSVKLHCDDCTRRRIDTDIEALLMDGLPEESPI